MCQRLQHDVAWAISHRVLEIFAPLLRDEEQADAFAEIYAVVKAGVESFEIMKFREETRLKPSRN